MSINMYSATNGYAVLLDKKSKDTLHIKSVRINKKTGYAQTWHKGKSVNLHRIIINIPKGFQVDHINGNKLDNRVINLRVCTSSQNQANRGPQKNNIIGYKGVSNSKGTPKFRAQITKNNRDEIIGYYNTKEEAAIAYNKKAKELFGDFAYQNLING